MEWIYQSETLKPYQCLKRELNVRAINPQGPRILSIIHTRLRHQCSSLNADLMKINVVNDPRCNCNFPFEDVIHYFLNVHCTKMQEQT